VGCGIEIREDENQIIILTYLWANSYFSLFYLYVSILTFFKIILGIYF